MIELLLAVPALWLLWRAKKWCDRRSVRREVEREREERWKYLSIMGRHD